MKSLMKANASEARKTQTGALGLLLSSALLLAAPAPTRTRDAAARPDATAARPELVGGGAHARGTSEPGDEPRLRRGRPHARFGLQGRRVEVVGRLDGARAAHTDGPHGTRQVARLPSRRESPRLGLLRRHGENLERGRR